jgi:nucleoside phosphorylase
MVGGARVFVTQAQMGSGGPGGSQQTVTEAIHGLDPSVIVLLGIAFGVDPKEQAIGRVLVSERIFCYEVVKVTTTRAGKIRSIARGDKPRATPRLVQGLRMASAGWSRAAVEVGTLLSGDKLIDNIDYRDSIHEQSPDAIGGEMEGAGLYAAAYGKKDWVIVKAICDWADGRKRYQKEKRQVLAADNAAAFIFHALETGVLG